jgi:hypothetical protein
MGANDSRSGSSSASGEFRIDTPIPSGTWPLEAEGHGVRAVAPDRVAVGDQGAAAVVVIVRCMPSIDGIVVDDRGAPIEGVYISS